MDRGTLKALVMALLSPSGIGGSLNSVSFKNLSENSERIVNHCLPIKHNKIEMDSLKHSMRDKGGMDDANF